MDIGELIATLRENHPDVVLIGDERTRGDYLDAVVGIDCNRGRVVYSRDRLIECFMEHDGMSYDEATEWVEYNIDRSLPYWGEHAPVIVDNLECA